MDTTTVLEIIKMIDTRLAKIKKCQLIVDEADDKAYFEGKEALAISLRDHLLSFIEGRFNAEENNTGE